MNKYMSIFLGLPKILYIKFKLLPLKYAVKLPILLQNKVKIISLKGRLKLNNKIKFSTIRIGFGNVGTFDINKRRSIIQIDGNIEFGNNINLGHGTKISVGKNGCLKIYDNVSISAVSAIICHDKIIIEEDCLISWENLTMDIDFHTIKNSSGCIINNSLPIVIEKNVWIGCRCTILEGTKISKNSILSSNSRISSKVTESNVIIGNYGRIIKKYFMEKVNKV